MLPANPGPPAPAAAPPILTSLLAMTESPGTSDVEYVIGGQQLADADREVAAQLLADDAMRIRCGKSPALARWRARRDGGPPATGAAAAAVRAYAGIGFGLPEDAAEPTTTTCKVSWPSCCGTGLSRRGWSAATSAGWCTRTPVKPDPLEPGGDGLVVYEVDGGTLVFRLWEIKKHESQNRISATIRRASMQLSSRGQEYLAKLAGPETVEQAGPLGELYAEIVELWLDGSDRAGAGVSVGTSAHHAPARPQAFGSIATAFPHFTRAGQRESIIVAVPDFPGFARRVREIVWSGL